MSACYFFADAVLDEARFELRRHGVRVAVQPKVLRLLIYLARHRDRVVPTDELFAVLWQGETVCRGSLKRAVRLARQALGDDGTQQISIRTVRTYGYQLVAPMARVPAAARAAPLPVSPTFLVSAAQ